MESGCLGRKKKENPPHRKVGEGIQSVAVISLNMVMALWWYRSKSWENKIYFIEIDFLSWQRTLSRRHLILIQEIINLSRSPYIYLIISLRLVSPHPVSEYRHQVAVVLQ